MTPFPPHFTNAITMINMTPKNTFFNLLALSHPKQGTMNAQGVRTFFKDNISSFLLPPLLVLSTSYCFSCISLRFVILYDLFQDWT